MAAFLIGQPDPKFKPRHQQVRTARGHSSGPGLKQLAQGGIKPEPQLDHLQEPPNVPVQRLGGEMRPTVGNGTMPVTRNHAQLAEAIAESAATGC